MKVGDVVKTATGDIGTVIRKSTPQDHQRPFVYLLCCDDGTIRRCLEDVCEIISSTAACK